MQTKVTFLSLLCIVGIFFTPLLAQESCYEQYLREHNMKILTAEDADDSYDELKKTVLAKQMYADSYLLMVDSIAQRVMITKVDGSYIADVRVALVDSIWYMWLSVDPLADKNIANTPYMYCNGNPIMLIDPDGRDWYEAEDGTITWTDLKSQQAMENAKLVGRYLGEAVVVFNGYYDETLGKDGKLINSSGEMPEGAKMAIVTVFGSNGKDDIAQYLGYTMSSNPEMFGVLANGEYNVVRDPITGPYGSPWAIEGRGELPTLFDVNPAHPERNPSYIDGVFVHRYNNDGFAGAYIKNNHWSGCSEGCLLIEPGKWSNFMLQLQKTNTFHLILNRR